MDVLAEDQERIPLRCRAAQRPDSNLDEPVVEAPKRARRPKLIVIHSLPLVLIVPLILVTLLIVIHFLTLVLVTLIIVVVLVTLITRLRSSRWRCTTAVGRAPAVGSSACGGRASRTFGA